MDADLLIIDTKFSVVVINQPVCGFNSIPVNIEIQGKITLPLYLVEI